MKGDETWEVIKARAFVQNRGAKTMEDVNFPILEFIHKLCIQWIRTLKFDTNYWLFRSDVFAGTRTNFKICLVRTQPRWMFKLIIIHFINCNRPQGLSKTKFDLLANKQKQIRSFSKQVKKLSKVTADINETHCKY